MIFRFAQAWVLHLLWLVPLLVVITILRGKLQQKRLIKYLGSKTFPLLAASASTWRKNIKLFLQALVLVFMLLALARPQSGQSEQKLSREGIELMILFDVSRSMLAEDVKPSRLEFAKKEIIRFLDLGVGHKVGLIAFAGSGLLLSPMTIDKSALKMFLSSLTTDSVSSQGTEFQGALLAAQGAFQRGGNPSSGATRAILIVSDGEDHDSKALSTAEKLTEQNIRIFSLGFGTKRGGPIPMKDRYGTMRSYRKDKTGKVIITQTKGTVLRELARRGQGSFRHVTHGGSAIEELIKDLQQLRQSQFDSMTVRKYDEKYQWFLGLAFLLAILEILLKARAPRGKTWRGRFEVLGP